MAHEGAAYRPHQITDGKYAKGRKKLGDRIPVREKVVSDRNCEVAVDREIVPLEHVADHAGSDRLILRRRTHVIAPLIAVGEVRFFTRPALIEDADVPMQSDLPLEHPIKFKLVVNLKTARFSG